MSVGCGVEDNNVELAPRLLDPGDQLSLDIGLAKIHFRPFLRGTAPHHRFDVRQGGFAVNSRLASAEKVEIRPV